MFITATRVPLWTVLLLACFLIGTRPARAAETTSENQTEVNFTLQVRPILADKCFFCHGPDVENREADLRFDVSPETQQRDEPAIVGGDREASLMWQRIVDQDDPMPPVESHKSLKPEEIEILGRWIDNGAPYVAHWAYSAVEKRLPPQVDDDGWSVGSIDQFLFDAMSRNGLRPSAQASPTRLIRRLYLDLIGLPPEVAIAQSFVADPSDDAYAAVVDELLDDPRFGEHWAAWWLDLVRYGDSVGFHGDQARSVWPYRDWVINAFNNDMPFDQFTRLQLAGDLIEKDGETQTEKAQRLFASAYNRLGPVTAEGGAQGAEYRAIYAADRVSNFGEVWLASSTGCARCHDHKYDPFTTADFYSLSAVFEDIDHSLIASPNSNPHWGPYHFFPQDDEQAAQVASVDSEYFSLLAEHPEAGPYQTWSVSRDAGPAPPHGDWKERVKELFKQRNELAKTVPVGLVTRTLPQPRVTKLLPRGNWLDETGPVMQPRAPEFLAGESGQKHFNRLDLANWLFETQNPLTARVLANRLWERFFGRGISGNTLDVGNQGAPPTHPELLDWLAMELRENGWSLKSAMKSIVMSRAYRQASDLSPMLAEKDASNRWFARQSAKRLRAEILRDQSLAASGLLVDRRGGPSVFPYQPEGHWDALNFPKRKYQQSHGHDLYRRSVYTWVQRTFPHPAMTVFDAPNRESCTSSRSQSNTPLQALTLLNETLNVEASRKLAEQALLSHSHFNACVKNMFQRVLLRAAREKELQRLRVLFDVQHEYFVANPSDAQSFCQIGESPVSDGLKPAEVAAYASVARVILNLHETVTRP